MHAYRLTAEVSADHRLVLEVPHRIPPGVAEIVVLVPESANEAQELEDRMDLEAFREAKAEVDKEGTVPLEQVKAELGL